jgi:hypothetical protein
MAPEFEGGDSPQHCDFDCPALHDLLNAIPKVVMDSSENDATTSIELTLDDFGGRSDALGG